MVKELFKWYLDNQDSLLNDYLGKVLVIKDYSVSAAFDNEDDAITYAMNNYPLGSFIIQLCTPGDSAYTQTFHSRVSFA